VELTCLRKPGNSNSTQALPGTGGILKADSSVAR